MLKTQIEFIKNSLPQGSKIIVAMSGGVDSSVSAILLKKAGFEIVGITFDLSGCSSFSAHIDDAKKIAEQVGCEHHTIDYKKDFKEKIITYFIEGYKEGITPNPCTRCNKLIKFEKLDEVRRQFNADYVATGHYVKKINNEIHISGGVKDQSYFMSLTNKDHLKRTFFPLGNLVKSQVRAIAQELNLVTAQKKESQDICFIPTTYHDFMKKAAPEIIKQGDICDKDGNVLGRHEGFSQYTIGQRKNLGLSGGPWFVLKIDARNNRVIVGLHEDLLKKEVLVEQINLIASPEELQGEVLIKIRARHEPIPGIINFHTNKIHFNEPQSAITPGQVAAFYDKNFKLLGGSIISQQP